MGPDVGVVTVNKRLRGGGGLLYEAQVETSLLPYGSAARA